MSLGCREGCGRRRRMARYLKQRFADESAKAEPRVPSCMLWDCRPAPPMDARNLSCSEGRPPAAPMSATAASAIRCTCGSDKSPHAHDRKSSSALRGVCLVGGRKSPLPHPATPLHWRDAGSVGFWSLKEPLAGSQQCLLR